MDILEKVERYNWITSKDAVDAIRERCKIEPVTEYNAELLRFITNVIAKVVPTE